MKFYLPLVILSLSMSIGFAQSTSLRESDHRSDLLVDEQIFIFLGHKNDFLHLVWDENADITKYIIQQSFDAINYRDIDSIKPENMLDIYLDSYPNESDYYNRIMYSTETGNGRFVYNDVMAGNELNQRNIWYRIKMVGFNERLIYTKSVKKSFYFDSSTDLTEQSLNNSPSNNFGVSALQTRSGSGQRRSGCPDIQSPPAGFVPTGNTTTYYGDCCSWVETEYREQEIRNPCGAYQAWCCEVDCAPLAYDPCCVHTCDQYNQCSCPPWICCDVSNSIVSVVTSVSNYDVVVNITAIQDIDCNGGNDGAVTVSASGGIPPYNYSWDNGTSVGTNLVGLTAGNYSLTVADAYGCDEVTNFVISEPPPLTTTLNSIGNSCFGENDGSINLNVLGGTSPYSYSWNGGAYSTEDLNNLTPGAYDVTVTDVNGCITTNGVSFIGPNLFTGTITTIDVDCYGWSTGSATLTHTGGTPPYSYMWSNGQTGADDTSLTTGHYYVTATDANGCSFTDVAVIFTNPEITATITTNNATCGSCNGSATISASGGSGNLTYLWSNGATTTTTTGLCDGVSTVTVSDADVTGCGKSFAVTIGSSGGQSISTTKTDVTCQGLCTGSATVSGGGCAGCSISWHEAGFGSPIGQTTATATNLCGGDYYVQVEDASGCFSFEYVTINEPPELTGTFNLNPVTCTGACNAWMSAQITGGSPPYTYRWLDGTGTPIPFQSSPNLFNQCPGDYTLEVTDNQSCIITFDATIPNYNYSATTSATHNLCNGDCNGSIRATVFGGTPPFTYQWRDGNGSTIPGQTGSSIFNLCAGNYSVVISDNNSCELTSSTVSISEPSALTASISITDTLCAGDCNGSASVSASGGSTPYSYQWYNSFGLPIAAATGTSITNRCAGSYFIEVTDQNNCSTGLLAVNITENSPLVLDMELTNISCNGASDGAIDLTVSGGQSPYTYSWNGNQFTTEDLSGLGPDTYTVIVTDANNCTATDNVVITNPGTINLVANAQVKDNGYHINCRDSSDAAASVTVTGGTAPFSYQWSDPDSQTKATATGLALGSYTVTVIDAGGCSTSTGVVINLNPPPFEDSIGLFTYVGGYHVSCFGASDGMIDLTVYGGTPPFVYAWDNGIFFGEDPTGVSAGQHTVNIIDTANSCIIRDTVVLIEPPPLITSIATDSAEYDISCHGGSDGNINLIVSGGTPPYSYTWNGGLSNNEDLVNVPAGLYVVEVMDTNGCLAWDTVSLTEPDSITLTETHNDNICYGDSSGTINVTVTGGAAPYTYTWNNGAVTEYLNNIPAGTYVLTVTDSGNCSKNITIDITQPALVSDSASITICENDSVIVGGGHQNTPGFYYDTLEAASTCDSIVIIELIVLPASASTIDTSICDGESFFAGGEQRTTSGTYVDTMTSAGNCYTIITTNLSVNTINSTFENRTSCNPADTGIVVQNLLNRFGCDSTHTITTNYLLSDSTFEDRKSCSPVDTGVLVQNLSNRLGCDSIHTIKTTLYQSDPNFQLPSVSIDGEGVVCTNDSVYWTALAVPGTGAITNYQWMRNGSPVGPDTPYYTPSIAGNYSIEITDEYGCKVVSTKRLLDILSPVVAVTGDEFLCDTTVLTAFAAAGSGTIASYQWKRNGNDVGDNANTYNATQSGDYNVVITNSNDCVTASSVIAVTDTCTDSCITQDIPIDANWNMISSYIIPDNPDILDVISDIAADVVIFKDIEGEAAVPSFSINSIGNWKVEQGYKVKSLNPIVLTIGCVQVDPTTTPIYLSPGWNMISYLRTTPMNTVTALSGLNDILNVIIIKDIDGESYLPSLGINTIGDMQPGQGYSIKVTNTDTLYYPANLKTSSGGFYQYRTQPTHFIVNQNTGHHATIVIPEGSIKNIETGVDEIGIFNGHGMLTGAAVYEDRNLAIAVKGDDPTTDMIDGFEYNDHFTFRIWRANDQKEYTAAVAYESGDTTYRNDGISILKNLIVSRYENEATLNIYPNPTKGTLNLEFYLEENDAIQISLFDIYGKELIKYESVEKPHKGKHLVTLDLSEFATGVYLCEFKSGAITKTVKVNKH